MNLEKLLSLNNLNQLILNSQEEASVLNLFQHIATAEVPLLATNTENVQPLIHVIPMKNPLREDIQQKNFSRDELLKGAPEENNGYWQVPRLVE